VENIDPIVKSTEIAIETDTGRPLTREQAQAAAYLLRQLSGYEQKTGFHFNIVKLTGTATMEETNEDDAFSLERTRNGNRTFVANIHTVIGAMHHKMDLSFVIGHEAGHALSNLDELTKKLFTASDIVLDLNKASVQFKSAPKATESAIAVQFDTPRKFNFRIDRINQGILALLQTLHETGLETEMRVFHEFMTKALKPLPDTSSKSRGLELLTTRFGLGSKQLSPEGKVMEKAVDATGTINGLHSHIHSIAASVAKALECEADRHGLHACDTPEIAEKTFTFLRKRNAQTLGIEDHSSLMEGPHERYPSDKQRIERIQKLHARAAQTEIKR
jgi:hypothetical protein